MLATHAALVYENHLSASCGSTSGGIYSQELLERYDAGAPVVNPRDTTRLCSTCGEIAPKQLSERVQACDRVARDGIPLKPAHLAVGAVTALKASNTLCKVENTILNGG